MIMKDDTIKGLIIIMLILMTFNQVMLYEKIKKESLNNELEIKSLREELKGRSYIFNLDSINLFLFSN